MVWLVLILLIIAFIFISKNMKSLKIGSLALVTGGVKTGKSTLGCYLAIKEYKKARLRYRVRKLLGFKDEEPLFYSNIPIKVNHFVPIDKDYLLRKKRFNYGSVIFIDEASLVADSQLIKDNLINEQLLLFNKLIGHETHGGKLIYNTQSIQDCHYSIKRCVDRYFYVYKMIKWLPFFIVMKVQETRYSEDSSVAIVNQDTDLEDMTKTCIIPKSVWKKFDRYAFSILTDNNLTTCKNDVVNGNKFKSLKQPDVHSFRNYVMLQISNKKKVKENENKDS